MDAKASLTKPDNLYKPVTTYIDMQIYVALANKQTTKF